MWLHRINYVTTLGQGAGGMLGSKSSCDHCNTIRSVSLKEKHSLWSIIPDKHPIPDILVVFDIFLHLSYKPGESIHNLRQVL